MEFLNWGMETDQSKQLSTSAARKTYKFKPLGFSNTGRVDLAVAQVMRVACTDIKLNECTNVGTVHISLLSPCSLCKKVATI